MSVETFTTFFGWMAVINIGYLTLATLVMLGMRTRMAGVHQRMFGISEQELKLAYFNWIANYKIVALVFSVVPYIALRLL